MSREGKVCLLIWPVLVLLAVPVMADQPVDTVNSTHRALSGVVTKVASGVIFVQIPVGLRPRTISPGKADRLGLHEARIGDELLLWLDEGNLLVDAHKKGDPLLRHRLIAGSLNYADQYWEEIRLSTPEGVERFHVDPLAGSKLSVLQEGAPVVIELDEDNVVIDIHRGH